jgi:arylsulfatase A-like enzyme
LALALALAVVACDDRPPVEIREVARALLEDEGAWRAVETNARFTPEVGTLTPCVDWRARGGDRPSLVVPPGTEVVFEVRPEDGPVRLLSSVGVDMSNARHMKRRWQEVRFRFEVLVDETPVFDRTLALARGMEPYENEWHPLMRDGDPVEGIALVPGNVVRLRTSVEADPEHTWPNALPWRIGFSDLVLERRRARKRAESGPDAPSIVLILMDTQRRDRLGCYGYAKGHTPNLDALARRGTLYEAAYASSAWTWPSTASVLTGLTPESHGVMDGDSCVLGRNVTIVSEVLQERGFTTAGFSGNPLIGPSHSFDQGFEFFDASDKGFRSSRMLVPRVVEWLREHRGERFFLYLHLVDTHEPHRPTEEARARFLANGPPPDLKPTAFGDYTWDLRYGKALHQGEWDATLVAPLEHQEWLSDLYDACVSSGDHWIGEFLDALDGLGLTDETIVAFTSDHGEELFEHGMLEHGHALFDEVTGVPLILAGPGIPAGARSDVPVSNRHLASTLARVAGAELPAVPDAIDLSRPSSLTASEAQPVVFGTRHGFWNAWYRTPLQGMRDGDWVLHYAPIAGDWWAKEPTPGGQWRLYDLASDGLERDVAPGEPERADALLEALKESLRAARRLRTSPSFGGGHATREMLQGIGYLDSGDD